MSQPRLKLSLESLTAYLPLLWASLAFLAGILFASQVNAKATLWLLLAGILLVPVLLASTVLLPVLLASYLLPELNVQISSRILSKVFLAVLSLGLFFLGAFRYQITIPKIDAHYIAWYNDREYELLVTGTVIDPPDERDTYTNLRLQVSAVNTGDAWLSASGLLLARVSPDEIWHYGDVVRLRGHVKTPPENEDFSYLDYLARQGIHSYMPDAEVTRLPFIGGSSILRLVYAFKDHAMATVYRLFPDPEASLLAGILLGNDNGLSTDLQQAFKNTGTAHIIAISGFNIAIIAALFVTVFSRLLGQRRGSVVAVLGIALYTVLVGASPSVVRAAIMGSLALFACQIGRRQNGLNTLALTAAVMAAFNPNALWDAGFQLSFGATLGLILYAGPLQEWLIGLLARRLPEETARKVATPVSEFMLFTLAAQLTTLPIMAYQFGRISLVSILANPFILPVQPAVMILSGLALLFGLIYFPLGQLVGWIAWPFSAYTIRAVEFFNSIPHGYIVLGDFSFLFVVLFYALLFALTFAAGRFRQQLRAALIPSVSLVSLGVVTYLVWAGVFTVPDGRLHLTFLDVGSADAVLIRTPTGRALLVDGGPSPSKLSDAIGRRLSPFDRHLDWLVVASTQEQEVAALPRILDRYPTDNVLWAGQVEASYSAEQLDRWLAAAQVPVIDAYEGAALDLGAGAKLNVVGVSSRGAVLLVDWQGFRALLPIGVNFDVFQEMQDGQTVGRVTALLLADSGYAPSNPPAWLANLQPEVVILSVAAGDPDGLPDKMVLDAVQTTTVLRTDRNGWIDVSTDGGHLWVTKEKGH